MKRWRDDPSRHLLIPFRAWAFGFRHSVEHVAPLELWPFLRHLTINIALLAELGLRAGAQGKSPVLRKTLEF
jgi:hypothetical protein